MSGASCFRSSSGSVNSGKEFNKNINRHRHFIKILERNIPRNLQITYSDLYTGPTKVTCTPRDDACNRIHRRPSRSSYGAARRACVLRKERYSGLVAARI